MTNPEHTTATESPRRPEREASIGRRVTLVGMLVNVLLVVLKLWIGFSVRSQALIADGVHSISDLVSDTVVLIGITIGRKGEDRDHPWGHARIESIAGMLVGIILVIAGSGIAYSAVLAIHNRATVEASMATIAAAAVSIVLKEALYWYTITIGRRIRSLALIGNAWHHRTDALSSVAVLIGVGAAYVEPEWAIADSLAALLVTYFIVRVGIKLIWNTLREVIDTAPDREVVEQIRQRARTVTGVRGIHDIRARYSGSQIFVEIHVVVDPDITVAHGHDIAKEVERRLLDEITDVTRVISHIDPETDQDD